MQKISKSKIEHIPREQNSRADSLSKLASCERKTQHNQQTMSSLSIRITKSFTTTIIEEDWIKSLKNFILAQEQGDVENNVSLPKKAEKFNNRG